jgi:hypothetical protein
VVQKILPGLKSAYDKVVKKNPGLSGEISFILEVGDGGKITKVTVARDTLSEPALTGAAEKALRGIQVKAAPGSKILVTISWRHASA